MASGIANNPGQAERLVVEGVRHWRAGYASGDLTHWQDAWELHVELLGPKQARAVVEQLARWVRTLQDCSTCPLQEYGCQKDRCRDECLSLAAVAACQNGDSACLEVCLKALVPSARHETGMVPVLAYANVIAEAGLRLEPIPIETVAQLAERPPQPRLH